MVKNERFYQSELPGKTTAEIEDRIKELKSQASVGGVQNMDMLCHELGTLLKEMDSRKQEAI